MGWSKAADRIWQFVKGTPAEVVRSFRVPDANLHENGPAAEKLEPRGHYFSIVVNEVFLAQERQWLDAWDPMALVVTEFVYDGQATTIPFVVGPSLLKLKRQDVPGGIALTDTQVAGLVPYSGGPLAVTVILARVKRASYGRRVLEFLETVANAVPAGAALTPQLKLAGAVLDGVDALFGMKGDTQSLAGHRWEYNDGRTPWLKPGFFAMLNTDEQNISPEKLGVVRGRLCDGLDDAASGFRRTDFLLYSLSATRERNDYETLPFFQLFKKARALAANPEPGNWDRAKAGLVTLYQEMLTSPDLTFSDAKRLFGLFNEELLGIKRSLEGYSELGPDDRRAANRDLARGLGLGDVNLDTVARLTELEQSSELMRL